MMNADDTNFLKLIKRVKQMSDHPARKLKDRPDSPSIEVACDVVCGFDQVNSYSASTLSEELVSVPHWGSVSNDNKVVSDELHKVFHGAFPEFQDARGVVCREGCHWLPKSKTKDNSGGTL